MIKVKAYWVPLGDPKKPVINAFFVIDITCWIWKRSICFHVHLNNTRGHHTNGMIMEHGFGEPNMTGYDQPDCEVRERY